jgi:hypothetical protein
MQKRYGRRAGNSTGWCAVLGFNEVTKPGRRWICFPPLRHYTRRMAHQAKWVLSCKNCHAECIYAEIPSDTESYFLPKKPQVPPGFKHTCEGCGHEDTYQRNDLSYRGETMTSRVAAKRCGESDRAFGAAK